VKPITAQPITSIGPLERAARKIARSNLDQQPDCKTCPQPVWFSAFFDGTGNNFDADGGGLNDVTLVKYSNVAKLARFAHTPQGKKNPQTEAEKKDSRTHFRYITGVGTKCKEEGVNDSGEGADKAAGMAVAAKAEPRIRWMMRRLKDDVTQHMPFVSQINLAVFGFSRGAAQARAFTRMLAEEMADWDGTQLLWKGPGVAGVRPKVVVYFLGIFDTVASVGYGGSRAESTAKVAAPGVVGMVPVVGPGLAAATSVGLAVADDGGHASWAHDMTIPDYVDRCVHYVAGHEVREKFPSDSVRKNKNLPSNCVEIVYPGMHSDVGGGYEPADDSRTEGRSNELSRIPLCHMYIEAYKAGVPLDEPAKVLKRAGELFNIDAVKPLFDLYMSKAPTLENTRLENAVVWHMNRYYAWREGRRKRMELGQLKPVQADPYMTITDAEWKEDVLRIAAAHKAKDKGALGIQETAIFEALEGKALDAMTQEERAGFNLFFDKYVHDSIAGFKKQMREANSTLGKTELSRWSVGRRYFVGKVGKRFSYWRYESAGTGLAGIRFVDSDKRNYEGEDDPAPVDKEQQELDRQNERQRKRADAKAKHDAELKRIKDAANERVASGQVANPDEYRRGTMNQIERENAAYAAELARIDQATAAPATAH